MVEGMVSILMPVYKGAPYLRQAIESVLAQTYTNVEIVAVDDGSPDDSVKVLESFGEPRIRVFRQVNTGNVGLVRNACIERARGEFVAFLDQDDWWLPTKLEQQTTIMKTNPRVALVHTGVRYYYEEKASFGAPLNPAMRPKDASGFCADVLIMHNVICNSSVLLRRSAVDDVGACDLRIPGNSVQDYDLWIRIAEKYELGFVPDEATVYRVHGSQGLWNRRVMLAAELEVLLRGRDLSWWLDRSERRRRLASVYDSLAIACLEQNDMVQARDCLRLARMYYPTIRTRSRYWISLLPNRLVVALRRTKAWLTMNHRSPFASRAG